MHKSHWEWEADKTSRETGKEEEGRVGAQGEGRREGRRITRGNRMFKNGEGQ